MFLCGHQKKTIASDFFCNKGIFFFFPIFCRSAGDTLTLEVYRKSGKHQSTGLTSEQLTNAQLQSSPVPPSTRTPTPTTVVNNPYIPANANKTSTTSCYQQPHQRHRNNLVNLAATATATTNTTTLKVAFNKSIGGGVLV